MQKRPRLLIGLSEVAGHYKGLKEGFNRIGIECTFVNFSQHPFGFSADDKVWPVEVIQNLDSRRRQSRGLVKAALTFSQLIMQSVLFFRLLPHHDIYIYCANRSFMAFFDLLVLRLFGKKIIYQMHGCDSRAPYLDGAYNNGHLLPLKPLYRLTRLKKWVLKITESLAHVVVNIPPQAHLCEKSYINWLYVGLPCCPLDYDVVDRSGDNAPGKIRIVHSPSRPEAKGTPEIRKAIERLQQRGVSVDYIELIGVPNRQVIEEIRRADLVIDQIYADYAMPGLATEAAWQGKPVLIAGYAVNDWLKWMPEKDLPPTHYCHPDSLETELFRLATDKEMRESIGKRMYNFVSERWSPEQVAKNYLKTLDSPPGHWRIDPKNNSYLHGCCISENSLKIELNNYLKAYGAKGLMLDDKPDLVRKLCNFANGDHV